MESIVVALDGSAPSMQAFALAVDLAQRFASRLTLVHVVEPMFAPPEPFGFNSAALEASHRAYGQELLDDASAKARDAGVEVQSELVTGSPSDALLRVADARKATLIVLGSRGQGRVGRLLLGSVSDRVLHHASMSVLVTH